MFDLGTWNIGFSNLEHLISTDISRGFPEVFDNLDLVFENPNLVFENLNLKFEILNFPKSARKRHLWIAELASFKMLEKSAFFVGRIAISRLFRGPNLTDN